MASKHLKKENTDATAAPEAQGAPAPKGSHEKKPSGKGKNASKAKDTAEPKGSHEAKSGKKAEKTPKKAETKSPKGAKSASPKDRPATGPRAVEPPQEEPVKRPHAPKHDASPQVTDRPVRFRRERAEDDNISQRDAAGALIALVAAVVLLAATVVVWVYRDSFSPDGMILSTETAAVPKEEYVFDAGSGDAFAAVGRGLAVANTAGLELLDGDGTPVTSMLMQMRTPAAAGCDDFAVFYDLGGARMAVARFDGTVEELDVAGDILSATVSRSGYIAVTTEYTGYRALVTVYDPSLKEIYRWYSSSAWVLSAHVSTDGRKLAVLSYTAAGSEVRFFSLSKGGDQATATFAVADTVLLDVHWFSSDRLCAISSEQVFFFDDDGQWQNTYSFAGQYLVGYTFDGGNCAAFALSPYRAGTTATLVSVDPTGTELGTASVQSGIICLTAADLEVMVLCSDGAILYNSSLAEKGRLTGLPGFKYALLRSRGEALLIASNYAEVYSF